MVDQYVVDAPDLQRFVAQLIRVLGADDDVAAEVALHLVRANLSGHDSHGVLRMPQYVAQIGAGELIPSARPVIARDSGSTALIDARRSFGPFSTAFALDWCVERARSQGIAAAAVRHSAHIGRLGEYAERAAARGLIAIVTAGMAGPGVGGMVPFGGRDRFLGTNPWAIGVPSAGGEPMVFDGATSTVAEGKVRFARARGAALPPGCVIDREGRPSTDPNDYYAGGALLPLGGEVAGHKGYGLALASALIGGLAMIDDPTPTLAGAPVTQGTTDDRGRTAGVFLAVVNPAAFGDGGSYAGMVGETLDAAKRQAPAAGRSEVLVPGELEARTREARSRTGVALPVATWNDLALVADRFSIKMPKTR